MSFLSTPSARRATAKLEAINAKGKFLSTPSARRATALFLQMLLSKTISIHALREEGDPVCSSMDGKSGLFLSTPSARRATRAGIPPSMRVSEFLSTPSARRATVRGYTHFPCGYISIHALREEGDAALPRLRFHTSYFYPRPPRGGRHGMCISLNLVAIISIHALREEGDPRRQG